MKNTAKTTDPIWDSRNSDEPDISKPPEKQIGDWGFKTGEKHLNKSWAGINFQGDTVLCLAWGETDRPSARLAKSADEVLSFIVAEWIDDKNDPLVKEIMAELAAHDWIEDGILKYEFEIGGVSFQDVCTV